MSHSALDSGPAAAGSAPAVDPEPGQPKAATAPPIRKRRRSFLPYGLILPAAILELLIHIGPMLLGIWIAFISLNQLNLTNWLNAPFVGLQNFVNGLNPESTIGQAFFSTVGRTLVYTILVVGFSWVLGMAGAVFLSSNFKGRALLRTFFLVPYALPAYVGTIAWAFMFNQRDGAVNQILVDTFHLFGDERPFWLLGENSFGAMIVVNVWQLWPFAFLMLMAALQNVPTDVYEAAAIDGASLVAAVPHHHVAHGPPGQRCAADGDVTLDLQPVQHSLCAVRRLVSERSHPHFSADLPELIRQLELRPGRRHERPAAHRTVHCLRFLHPHGAAQGGRQ